MKQTVKMNRQDLYDFLKKNRFEKYFNHLESHFRTSISIDLEVVDEDTILTGSSKMGGRPDLPANYQWPETRVTERKRKSFFTFKKAEEKTVTKHLSFIAQINLAEIKEYDPDNLLPGHGMLYFFHYSMRDKKYDFQEEGLFKVLYCDDDLRSLQRTDYPADLDNRSRYTACRIHFGQQIRLPSTTNSLFDFLDDDEQDSDRFFDVLDSLKQNKLFGYADDIQGEMEPSLFDDDDTEESNVNPDDWILLLQVDSNDETGMMWLDLGRLYFWINKNDLRNKRFDKCQCVLQFF
jgi:uncharacterized protein YwqG